MDDDYPMSEEQRIAMEMKKDEKRKKGRKIALLFLAILIALAIAVLVLHYISENNKVVRKPVIYLYPEETTEVSVKLDFAGKLTCTYPFYQDGWTVTAQPDGTLTDADGKVYNYLYWEGKDDSAYDLSEGFCVKGSETSAFLEEALEKLGLTRREANEFIVYWLPLMEENAYNVISFQKEAYTDRAGLQISPEPDTVIRVFMAWYGSKKPVEIPAQELTAPERTGFTVVEWGGSEIKK